MMNNKKCCSNCRRVKVEVEGFNSRYLKCGLLFPIVLSGKYVSKNGCCPKWKSTYPKGYKEGESK